MSDRASGLRRRLASALGPDAEALAVIAEEAARAKAGAFLVGGPVRDLLLRRPVGDLDVLLTRGLETVTQRSAERLRAQVVLRARFLTATIERPGLRIDLSRARRESYARSGALPEVEPASIEEDFARRDFSVNAMALPLDARSGRGLLDPLGGRADLERGRLRCLHERSFLDDPTRLLRAARYGARLGFRYDPPTARLLRSAVEGGALDRVSGDRIRHEIERLIEEPDPARAATATRRVGLFGAIARGWEVGDAARAGLRRLVRATADPPWHGAPDARQGCGLRLLLFDVAPRHRPRVLERLAVRGRPADQVRGDLRRTVELRRPLARPLSGGRLDAHLSDASEEALLLSWCTGAAPVPRNVARYAGRLRHVADPLTGEDARELGLRGPAVGELLRAARARSLDGGPVDDAWLRRWLARHQDIR
ncbi:MAG: CCA tRNA nucleotidyltransferase [Deltaproteobacteria bacterium]|nr:CCA tRNA nucleotidyltransferase [Deltaproteobacteria bacterium]MBW2413023.1 CCA tRNA nucleotidyltransferase [Deltaproteobacteria bacterium]